MYMYGNDVGMETTQGGGSLNVTLVTLYLLESMEDWDSEGGGGGGPLVIFGDVY